MTKDRQAFAEVGGLLFGPQWTQSLADALRVSKRSVERWGAGKYPIPPNVWSELADLCENHGNNLADLARHLRQ